MNAHADMLIVVGHNGYNIPRDIYCSLVSGVRKFPVFKSPKQAPINAFLLCLRTLFGVCGCKGTKKIAYAQGLCDFFGVECKDGQQSCSLEDARYTRYSLEFKGKDTRITFVKHPKTPRAFSGTPLDNEHRQNGIPNYKLGQ